MDQVFLSGDQFILGSLLIQIGYMASLASLLATTRFYQRLLRQGVMRPADPYWFALSLGVFLSVGVGLRVLLGYSGMDLSLPGTLLAGLFAGPLAGALTGTLAGGTAALGGELLSLPFGVVAGLLAGVVSRLPDSKRQRWDFSPYPYVNFYRFLKSRTTRFLVPVVMSLLCLGLDVVRTLATQEFGSDLLWSFQPSWSVVLVCVWITSLITLGVPIKIWNNTRIEALLKEQEGLAVQARLDALTQQINPHFLFNTLNSISSATRLDPEMARGLIQKLSAILRRVLEKQSQFVTLEEELHYIDAYLDIEVARFGREKLRVVQEVEAAARQTLVPCMVLQPLVENAVLHGIASLPSGGTVAIRARYQPPRVEIEVVDDGMGFDLTQLDIEGIEVPAAGHGIGLANVHQRLKIAFGHGLEIHSERGSGTRVRFEVPCVPAPEFVTGRRTS